MLYAISKPLHKFVLLLLFVIIIVYAVTTWNIIRFSNTTFDGVADAAVVLGAAAWGNRPSPVYRVRINQAVLLYRQGKVHWLIFTGGTPILGYPSEAEVGRSFALRHGIPATAILIDTESRSTWENLVHAKGLMKMANLQSVILVSDPLHMCRAMAMAVDLNMVVHPAPTTSSRYHSVQTWGYFLLRETTLYLGYELLHYPS